MKTAAFVALLPTLAFASLFTRDTYSGLITLSALGSGTPVQNLTAIGYSTSNQNEITASDGHFYIGKPTASIPCPTRLCKLPTNITAIVVVNTRAHMVPSHPPLDQYYRNTGAYPPFPETKLIYASLTGLSRRRPAYLRQQDRQRSQLRNSPLEHHRDKIQYPQGLYIQTQWPRRNSGLTVLQRQ